MEANLRFNAYVRKNTSDARVASGNIARKRRKRMFTLEDGPGPRFHRGGSSDPRIAAPRAPLRDHASRVQSRSRACVVQCPKFQGTALKEQFGTILELEGWNVWLLRPQTFDTDPLWACLGPPLGKLFRSVRSVFSHRVLQIVWRVFYQLQRKTKNKSNGKQEKVGLAHGVFFDSGDATPLCDCHDFSQSRKAALL